MIKSVSTWSNVSSGLLQGTGQPDTFNSDLTAGGTQMTHYHMWNNAQSRRTQHELGKSILIQIMWHNGSLMRFYLVNPNLSLKDKTKTPLEWIGRMLLNINTIKTEES